MHKEWKCLWYHKEGGINPYLLTCKDELILKNWGTISLLNVDHKIMSKVMSNFLENVIDKLIHPNESGFMNGRFIGEGTIHRIFIRIHRQLRKIRNCFTVRFWKAFDSIKRPLFLKHLQILLWGRLHWFGKIMLY